MVESEKKLGVKIDGLRPPSPFPQHVKVLELQRAWLQSKGYATEFVADIIKKIEAGEINESWSLLRSPMFSGNVP